MRKALKWIGIIFGGLIFVVILALLVIPKFIDIQEYKPIIEKKVAEATGRPFRLGGGIDLSFFPWAGMSLSDLHLGNPEGFREKDFLEVKSFEVRVKLLPLIFKDVQVKKFLLTGARIVLERRKDGKISWGGLGRRAGEAEAETGGKKEPSKAGPGKGLPIRSLAVGDLSIREGAILWIDDMNRERKEISDITLALKDVSLERPFALSFSAKMDGKPITLKGKLGPLGREPGKGDFPLELAMKALDQVDLKMKGKIVNPAIAPGIDLDLEVGPFSPRELAVSLGTKLPISTADPEVLKSVGLKAKLKGTQGDISISEGTLIVDQSRLAFSLRAKEFHRPDIAFNLELDEIDLDRYLPPKGEEKAKGGGGEKGGKGTEKGKRKIDYSPLRRLVLDGTIYAGKLKVKDIRAQEIKLKIRGRNGIFRLDPLDLKLYEGTVNMVGAFNLQGKTPVSRTTLHAKGIKAGSFLKDMMKKDFLEGTLKSDLEVSMVGDDPEKIKGTLNGKGALLFNDGAIVGIDLAGMARNVKTAFGLGEQKAERPKTDFTELSMPFTVTDGVVKTSNTRLMSPLLRVLAKGKADLVEEILDFRLEPRIVVTLKGQGDTVERKGITVPVLVSGTFSKPRFRPDLKGVVEKEIKKRLEPSELVKGQGEQQAPLKELEEKAKGFLKGLPLGR